LKKIPCLVVSVIVRCYALMIIPLFFGPPNYLLGRLPSTTCVSHADRRCSRHPCTAAYVRDLGIYLDRDLSMHVQRTVSRCFAALRQLQQIRHSVSVATFQTLVVALVHSRLDYGNSVLVDIPVYLIWRLQSALNAAARLIFHLRRSDRISDALVCLHWLRVPDRIEFKIAG